jgi:putative thioredoxin
VLRSDAELGAMHIIIILAVLALVAGVFFYRNISRARGPGPGLSPYEANVTTKTFADMVARTSNNTPVLVDFHATWCAPCQYLGPILSEMAKSYDGRFLLAKVDVDAEPSLTATYNVQSMPTVVLFRDGRGVARFEGAREERSIRYFLAQHGVHAPEQAVAQNVPT